MAIAKFFTFVPTGMDWATFNAGLIQDYGEEPIEYDQNEENWNRVVDNLAELPTFAAYPVPGSIGFETWQSWAFNFIGVVNGPTN